jgi:hypothetical protein
MTTKLKNVIKEQNKTKKKYVTEVAAEPEPHCELYRV